MRPRKTHTPNHETGALKASVTDLSSYRQSPKAGQNQPPAQAIANLSARHALIVEHVTSRIETCAPDVVAAAIVLLRSDGTLDTSAAGVEPEFAPFLTRGLTALSTTINSNAKRRRNGPAQGGSSLLPFVSAIAFMAATYINDYAWLDAALSLAAQFCATHLWRKST